MHFYWVMLKNVFCPVKVYVWLCFFTIKISILNPHEASSDNWCNIDDNLSCECKYYDTNAINQGVITQSNFSMFHLNTRSLGKNKNKNKNKNKSKTNNKTETNKQTKQKQNKTKQKSDVVDYCSVIDDNFDVYALTETRFNSDDDSNLIDFNHYANIDCKRHGRSRGGTSWFIHPKHNFIGRPDLKINATVCIFIFYCDFWQRYYCWSNIQTWMRGFRSVHSTAWICT